MRPARVLLVGYEDQDNLGLRYLASRLREAGHEPRLTGFREGPAAVVDAARAFRPDVVGLSLIFQFYAPRFAEVVAALRASGLSAHLCVGGHFASFEPGRVLAGMPGLDSVVRFEGEDSLVALAERVVAGREWRDLPGLACLADDGTLVETGAAPAREDLDTLPWPERDDIDYASKALPMASMLGSRGCPWRCSFCSIITFYEGNGTRGRRRRDPQRVVDEIEFLHRERGVEILLWQDDDFLAGGPAATRWAHDIARELQRRGLSRAMRWKISCRSDEVKESVLAPLVDAGLTHVYLGVEAGSDDDLKRLNKLLRSDVHLRAGDVLRNLELSFDFGFMLLNPWSDVASVRANLAFLREFVGDGASAAGFCRMLPYAGTPAAARVAAEGRLIERGFDVDYRFLDPRLDRFYDWTLHGLGSRNAGSVHGTWNLLRLLSYEAHLDLPGHPRDEDIVDASRALIAESNELMISVTEQALDLIESGVEDLLDPELEALREVHAEGDARMVAAAQRQLARRSAGSARIHAVR